MLSNDQHDHFTLSWEYLGATHEDGTGHLVFIYDVFLSIFFYILFFDDAVSEYIFLNWIGLSGHSTLICCDLGGLE
jgi:hypothetical protein